MWYPAVMSASPPVTEPVTRAMAKRQCGVAVSDTSRDDDIDRLILAERGRTERYCTIKIPQQTVTVACDGFADFARCPVVPVESVESIGYVDRDGADQVLDAAIYELRSDHLTVSIVLKQGRTWPYIQLGSRITLVLIAGFDPVPAEIIEAMLLRIGARYRLGGGEARLKKTVVEGVGSREWDISGAVDAATERAAADLLENFRCWPLT